jgi:protein-S-isoprenylcysteine O-methyltransferase Ste14
MFLRSASIIATLLLVAVVLELFAAGALFARGPVAIGFQVIAVALMIWARVTFGLRSFHAAANPTEGGLVTRGPYRWIRHPIYSAILIFTWAGALSHVSMVGLGLGVVATLAVGIRIAAEERLLIERYPEYADYAARTRRIVPFVI